MNARLRASTDAFAARVRAAHTVRQPRAAREDTPAEKAAFAAFREHAERTAAAILGTCEAHGITDTPARAGRYGEAA